MLPPIPLVAALMVMLVSMFGTSSIPGVEKSAAPAPVEAVLNGSAATDLIGWAAFSDQGTVTAERFAGRTGAPKTTGVLLSRSGSGGQWSFALISIHRDFFQAGKYYRMVAWVRDLKGKGRDYGLQLADKSYENRPTDTIDIGRPQNTSWTQIARTFQASSAGGDGTEVYLSLPTSGSFQVEVTGVSVQRANPPMPPKLAAGAAPSQTITFPGKAGTAPDPKSWNHEIGGPGWGNGERQAYTGSTENARTDGKGGLEIVVRRNGDSFTSARINTNNKLTVKAGSYFEADITGATGKAVWPAVWLMGANYDQVSWPAAGELDVYEAAGGTPTTTRFAVHLPLAADPSKDRAYSWGESGASVNIGVPLDAAAHKYGAYFSDKMVRFYIDRKPQMTIWAQDAKATGRGWPFGKPMFIVMNMAIAPNVDVTETTFPRTMTVHSLKVWNGGTPF